MTGSDISAEMVAVARQAAARENLRIALHVEPIQTCRAIGGQYGAALAMFASLGYLLATDDLVETFTTVRALLPQGGIFVFDVWNATAVLEDYSPSREKRVEGSSMAVRRVSRTTLDRAKQVATVDFDAATREGRVLEKLIAQ